MERKNSWFDLGILAGLVLVLLLEIYPLPSEWRSWRPHFVLMLCCYLTALRIVPFTVEFSCLAGLLTDLVTGSVLGTHALAFAVPVAVLAAMQPRLRHGGLIPETLIITLLTLLSGMILQSLNLIARDTVYTDWVLFPAVTTLLLWLPLRGLLHIVLPRPAV